MNGKQYMGVDQYGTTYHGLGSYPRKALMERIPGSVSKMYNDKDGRSVHVGYVIGGMRGLWINLYEVVPFEVAA